MMNIDHALEIVDCMDTLAADIKAAKEGDGDIDIWDSPKFVNMIAKVSKVKEDAGQIVLEIKDLDIAEVQVIMNRLFAASLALMEALSSKSAA